jgi:hypothetical protein
MESEAMQTIPVAAVPVLPSVAGRVTAVTHRVAPLAIGARNLVREARPDGFEPSTSGFEGRLDPSFRRGFLGFVTTL